MEIVVGNEEVEEQGVELVTSTHAINSAGRPCAVVVPLKFGNPHTHKEILCVSQRTILKTIK